MKKFQSLKVIIITLAKTILNATLYLMFNEKNAINTLGLNTLKKDTKCEVGKSLY